MAEWRPIETAPKDVRIFVWDGCAVHLAKWSNRWEDWIPLDSNFKIEPTHWMPLPNPPAPQARGEGEPHCVHCGMPESDHSTAYGAHSFEAYGTEYDDPPPHDAGTKERETNHNLYSSDKIQSEQESEDAEFHKELRAGREQGRGLPDNQLDPSCGDAGVAAGAEPVAPSPSVGELVERLEDEAERLSGHSIDRGSVDAGIAANLANEAATALKQQEADLHSQQIIVNRQQERLVELAAELSEARAEIERLREALEWIAKEPPFHKYATAWHMVKALQEFAHAALTQGE